MQQHLIVWLIGFVVPVLLVVGADARGYHRAIATARLASDDGHRHMMWRAVSPGCLGRAVFRLRRGLVTTGFVVWLAAIIVRHFLAGTTMANFDSTMTQVAQEHSTRVMLYAMWHAAMLGSPRFYRGGGRRNRARDADADENLATAYDSRNRLRRHVHPRSRIEDDNCAGAAASRMVSRWVGFFVSVGTFREGSRDLWCLGLPPRGATQRMASPIVAGRGFRDADRRDFRSLSRRALVDRRDRRMDTRGGVAWDGDLELPETNCGASGLTSLQLRLSAFRNSPCHNLYLVSTVW